MTLFIFALLVGFFILSLLTRKITSWKICALCAAVSLTWIILFVARLLGRDVDELILGILMGGSAVGFMYYLSAKLPEHYEILKFPFLVTLFWVVYHTIRGVEGITTEVILLAGLWIIFGIIFSLYTNNQLQRLGKKIIECCKNW